MRNVPERASTNKYTDFLAGKLGRGRQTLGTDEMGTGEGDEKEGEYFVNKLIRQRMIGSPIPNTPGAPPSPTGGSGGFSMDELTDMVYQAGWRGQDVPLMVSTIMRESGGSPGALNDKGEYSRGLLQINTGPGANTQYADRNLMDPTENLRTGFEMFQNSGYQPWYGYSTNLPPRIANMQRYFKDAWAASAARGIVQGGGNIGFDPGGQYGPQYLSSAG